MDSNLALDLPVGAVIVESMPQQLGVHHSIDDWTGVTCTLERRRRQNRLNQRTRRKNKRVFPNPPPILGDYLTHTAAEATDDDSSLVRQTQEDEESDTRVNMVLLKGYLLLPTSEKRTEFQRFMQKAYEDYHHGAPKLEHLQLLVRLNVLGAIAHNAVLLQFRFKGLCRPDLVSPLNLQGTDIPAMSLLSQPCPNGLRPTTLQVTVMHHPWIDLIPSPQFRENVLRAMTAGLLESKELGLDLLNVDNILSDSPSFIIWGESWDLRGWEASLSFWRKWGWLMEGCPVLLEATNFWRQKRGEAKISF
ncbi:hypothetical protein BDP55DRAFT_688218 [Colletotrichum godetiae]|uniref:Aryl-alcohol dehydrogenase n=1 Tax=Colletotrichum godetiae TaxID=1209918 RepID=A0AAJ0EKQ2_9PEZI|nr:uncharacterized protein BDP55DRAFT_688218 [Colletotrichum godetiae]KAK1656700.1 hypothetical protein BDP55DRAFT_688218 [Colletotrichum godetiae]